MKMGHRDKILTAIFIGIAALSLGYACSAGFPQETDLQWRMREGQAFLDGYFAWAGNQVSWATYPPFWSILFAPLALLSKTAAHNFWLVANLAFTAFIVINIHYCWGKILRPPWTIWLGCFLMTWVSWRVTLRQGQLSLFVLLLLTTMYRYKDKQKIKAGICLSLSLIRSF